MHSGPLANQAVRKVLRKQARSARRPLKERRVYRDLAYFFFDVFSGLPACASLSAAPRMSPSDAPESDDPYCATACFSSAICSALTEKFGFLERSKPITMASSFWP